MDDYLSEKEFLAVHHKLNPRYYISILEDKYVFDRFLKGFGFPIAELIGLIENGIITWIPDGKKEAVESLLQKNLDCYCKMITGWGGSKVNHLEVKEGALLVNHKSITIEAFKTLIGDGIYVLQETLQQHPALNRLNPSCVNTLRIITINDGETVRKHGGFIRIGVGGSPVDNVSSGNIACGIYEDGFLFEKATDGYLNKLGLTHHPDTHIAFGSFKIPLYHEAIELAVKMHKAFHCFFIIGWDIAITPTGPVAIEGNPLSTLVLEQVFTGGIRKEFYQIAEKYRKSRKIDLS